jgi:hypothetical protein
MSTANTIRLVTVEPIELVNAAKAQEKDIGPEKWAK